ncbi:MAG: radical SAM protein [bacterium]
MNLSHQDGTVKNQKSKKFALIHIGNDTAYGLMFVAGEFLKHGHKIKWFDGDDKNVISKITKWKPDFACFSPLSTFFMKAEKLAREIKSVIPNVTTVFGGIHVFAVPECVENNAIDIIVKGPVYGTVDKIISSTARSVINGTPVPCNEMRPAVRDYYTSIPRMANRHRKYIMSHFGCLYNCSYCTNSLIRKHYGTSLYNKYWMNRRSVEDLIKEARVLSEFDTKEISLEDDDALAGADAGPWIESFTRAWKKEIGLPVYANVTPQTVVRASDKTLKSLAKLVNSVQMGVQTARLDSLKLFNRGFQKEEQVKKAYDRLFSFGIKVKLEIIIGLPVKDPLGDAIDTVKLCQRVAPGGFATCFPLMLYPGTTLYRKCITEGIPLNNSCEFEWHSGEGSIKFDPDTSRRIKNITKMATFFVKYNVNERWMRAFIDMDLTKSASRQFSECTYLESLTFRLGEGIKNDFDNILNSMHFRY